MNGTLTLENLNQQWRARARAFTERELQTGLMLDLHRALEAAEHGRVSVVMRWIDLVEGRLVELWSRYECTSLVEEEVTAETVLGHQFLGEGVDGWLDVLCRIREEAGRETLPRTALIEQALEAQRLLLAVQKMAEESEDVVDRFLLAWKN